MSGRGRRVQIRHRLLHAVLDFLHKLTVYSPALGVLLVAVDSSQRLYSMLDFFKPLRLSIQLVRLGVYLDSG